MGDDPMNVAASIAMPTSSATRTIGSTSAITVRAAQFGASGSRASRISVASARTWSTPRRPGPGGLGAAGRPVERADAGTLARRAALSAPPAPTGAEGARGARLAELFREVGLSGVAVDHAGNVRGWYGNGRASSVGAQHAAPLPSPVVLAAHLDTVFGPDVDVRVKRRGQRLEGPGISDNARGLTAPVAGAEAPVAAGVPTARPILFAATVGEEGSGDLRGVKYLLNGGADHLKPVAFIALDGAGLERVIHRALHGHAAPAPGGAARG